MTLSEFRGKTALVTGASRGIGRAVAANLSAAGIDVLAVARDLSALISLKRQTAAHPGAIKPCACDITDARDLESLLEDLNHVSVLVNAAGWASPRTSIQHSDPADWSRTLAVCLHSPMRIVQILLPRMLASDTPAAIFQILSPAARRGLAGEAAYAAAKAGLRGFTESLRDELRDSAIKVVSIYPGYVDTDFVPANRRADRSRFLQPDDVARAVVQCLDTPAHCCPTELVLEPQRDPLPRK